MNSAEACDIGRRPVTRADGSHFIVSEYMFVLVETTQVIVSEEMTKPETTGIVSCGLLL